MANLAIAAADTLARQKNIEAEVIDLRSLSPIDWDTCADSLHRTHRLLVVEEDCRFAGAGAEIIATLTERCFFDLDAAPTRLAGLDMPTPFNAGLEAASIPGIDDIVSSAETAVSAKR